MTPPDDDDITARIERASEQIAEAQLAMFSAIRELEGPGPGTEEMIVCLTELCDTNPEFAAETIMRMQHKLRTVLPHELTKVLDLNESQVAALKKWHAERFSDEEIHPDLFALTRRR